MMKNLVVVIIVKPLSLIHIFSLQMLRYMASANLLWWKLLTLPFTLINLPLRLLTAMHHGTQLERIVGEMEMQLASLMWEKKETEELLESAVKEREILEAEFEEIEDEHDKALARIDLLQKELDKIKMENMRLNEVHGKSIWDYKVPEDKLARHAIPSETNSPLWSPSYRKSSMIHKDATWEVVEIGNGSLEQQRNVALARSLFSALMSLLVGMIVWAAEDPCMPLVAALFTVVAMSLSSVMDFFATIKNKPASHAVALLSLNWFILGTLTFPTLPSIVRILLPRAIRFADKLTSFLGFAG